MVVSWLRASSVDRSSAASRGRLRCRPLPKVASKGWVVSRCMRAAFPKPGFSGSSSSDMGSFFSRSSTVYASLTCSPAHRSSIRTQLAVLFEDGFWSAGWHRDFPRRPYVPRSLKGNSVTSYVDGPYLSAHRLLRQHHAANYLRWMGGNKGRQSGPTFAVISSRNCSSCFCPITRVLPNQRRSGWMRLLGRSFDWYSCAKAEAAIKHNVTTNRYQDKALCNFARVKFPALHPRRCASLLGHSWHSFQHANTVGSGA